IARMLKLSRNTVRRYLRSEGLAHYQREPGPSKLDRYKQYLAERVKAAAPDWIPATVLLHELKALGYSGSYSILKEHLRPCGRQRSVTRGCGSSLNQAAGGRRTSNPSEKDAPGCRCSSRRWAGAGRLTY